MKESVNEKVVAKKIILNPNSPSLQKKRHSDPKPCNVITKDNIFACNLKFSNLFLSRTTESQENDLEFIDNFAKIKKETEDNLYTHASTGPSESTEGNEPPSEQCGSLGSSNEYLNHDLIKLIDSPNKHNNRSPLKGKRIIISDAVSSKSSSTDSPAHKLHEPNIMNMQNMNTNISFNNAQSPVNMNNFININRMGMGSPGGLTTMNLNNTMNGLGMNTMIGYMPGTIQYPTIQNNFYNKNFLNVFPSMPNTQSISSPNIINPVAVPNIVEKSYSSNDIDNAQKAQSPNMPVYQRYTEMSEEELIQNSKELSKDQGGCRFLQKLLDSSTDFSQALYVHLESDLIELINDSFGNYLIQKLIEKLPSKIIDTIITTISPYMMDIGINPHGTRVLQRLIEVINSNEQKDRFIKYFIPCVIPYCNDINGNHIIQKFITTISYPKNQFIFDIIQKNVTLVGLNKHGCCALQKCIEFGTEKQRNDMINSSIKHSRSFLTDQYGNYVLQNIITYKNFAANRIVTESFLKDILKLSKEKFSSNVIEKCMDYCDKETKEKILKKLANPEYIPALLVDMYGNYVIQKALQISYEPYYTIFIENIGPVLGELRNLPFGTKLYTKFINNYSEFAEYVEENGYYDDYYGYDSNWSYQK